MHFTAPVIGEKAIHRGCSCIKAKTLKTTFAMYGYIEPKGSIYPYTC